MSNSYYEKGANHYDHHKELHIDTMNGGDIGKLLSAFFKDDAEDAVIVGEEKEVKKPKKTTGQKPEKPRETMTFGRKSGVTEGHIVLLYQKLVKEGWIEGNDADFKALFSGSRDEDCELVWLGKYGKGTLVELFKQFVQAKLIVVSDGFTLSSILEGHFKDTDGKWLTGLDKGDSANSKALPVIQECVKLLKADPEHMIYGNYDEDEDARSEYDQFDQQDMHWHKR
ncbi:MAG: hypothetical protein IKX20_09215 [Paludibacteraceae bacterium]|nr:hypothetical protein [Paludibacteraceae bacterium]